MSQLDSRPVRVCLIAESCLAEGYLRNLLHEYSQVRALGLRQYLRLSPIQRARTIFVIDVCGLEVPLYECLEELRARCPSARFLLLGNEKSKEELFRLLAIGAQGYIQYPAVARSLVKASFRSRLIDCGSLMTFFKHSSKKQHLRFARMATLEIPSRRVKIKFSS